MFRHAASTKSCTASVVLAPIRRYG